MRLSELGELGLLAELERRRLISGVENDAADLGGGLVVTQDTLVEGVHFRLNSMSWLDLGFRASAVNISDLAASGADPEAVIVSLGLPGSTDDVEVFELYEGIAETGVRVAGGDTTAAELVIITVTAIGRSERIPGRTGAAPGDLLVVTGPLGGSGVAFQAGRFVRPPIRIDEGKELAAHAHGMLDISDGIAVDAGHLARRSGVRCVIDLDAVPLAPGARVGDLAFGDDYELLAAVAEPGRFPVVGHVEPGDGVELLLDGEPHVLRGWEHFKAD
jgi:thiamine-monophosphate kinase